MNYLQKTAIFIGIVTAINSITFAAHAQTCAEFSHTPVTKARLDELAANQYISISQVGRAFQNFALATIRPGIPIPENTKLFRSDDREIATDGKHKYVQPDGVLPLVVELFATPPATYLNSVFYEVKAVKGTLLPPGYSEDQILGFLDALSKSDAARAGEDPAIIFLTNVDKGRLSIRAVMLILFYRKFTEVI